MPTTGNLHAVVMAGGSGTRFWPASRAARPKQVLPLAHGQPLLAATLARLDGLCDPDNVWLVTNPGQLDAVRRAVPDLPEGRILIEPEARDTAPCIALATAAVAARDPDAAMVVMPADHVLGPADAFHTMVRRGRDLAADDRTIVTFGITPTHAATGFGYIEPGQQLDDGEPAAFHAERFREKPDRATAEQFVAAGMLWNSGIFVWSARGIMAAMQESSPELLAATEAMRTAFSGGGATGDELAAAFRSAPKTSIDYAVMENAPAIAVVRATIDWNDVGGLAALADIGSDRGDGNHALLVDGAQDLALESKDNLVFAEGDRTVCLFGVRDLVVVAVGDAVLVCPRDRAAELKKFVEHVRAKGRDDLL